MRSDVFWLAIGNMSADAAAQDSLLSALSVLSSLLDLHEGLLREFQSGTSPALGFFQYAAKFNLYAPYVSQIELVLKSVDSMQYDPELESVLLAFQQQAPADLLTSLLAPLHRIPFYLAFLDDMVELSRDDMEQHRAAVQAHSAMKQVAMSLYMPQGTRTPAAATAAEAEGSLSSFQEVLTAVSGILPQLQPILIREGIVQVLNFEFEKAPALAPPTPHSYLLYLVDHVLLICTTQMECVGVLDLDGAIVRELLSEEGFSLEVLASESDAENSISQGVHSVAISCNSVLERALWMVDIQRAIDYYFMKQ
eukprot:TRINITY_DN1789_c0_g1_i5.p1 TRINITY_DN1789_c0_g1~~TRINITY_DN1789_c0_g1_i5.p1  ORF type:complete len:309 (+),score=77.32 TRINITY_DN1789_c0_g1_i5:537-1463(+)